MKSVCYNCNIFTYAHFFKYPARIFQILIGINRLVLHNYTVRLNTIFHKIIFHCLSFRYFFIITLSA